MFIETIYLFELPFLNMFWYLFLCLKLSTLTNSERFHIYIFGPFLTYYNIVDPVKTIIMNLISFFINVNIRNYLIKSGLNL